MDQPSSWELFQSVLIGSVAGIIASGVVNRGILYVAVNSFILWVLLIILLNGGKVLFEKIENYRDDEEEEEDRPYEDVNYAA
ncbi:hypothetical protein [Halomicrobium urmianum]|uniref:hypothetical protein n=1 Tax=Halomicrobium urmianum TaxID=1586233 RepID=UPI001CDA21A8|nr:hypothetical protein [Halomicrobium urmianum]